MGFVAPEFGPAMPEIVLALGVCIVLVADLFISDRYRGLTLVLALLTLLVTGFYTVDTGAAGAVLTRPSPVGATIRDVVIPSAALVRWRW